MAPRSQPRASIQQTFATLRADKKIAFMPFIPAGYPDLQTTRALLPALAAAGANIIEIGFPFSDPIADGPTIQAAFAAALEKKVRVEDIFGAIGDIQGLNVPIVGMVSYSIVYRYGVDKFLKDAKSANFSGLIIPDLPPPEANAVCEKVQASGLDTILLVAPTTSPQRRKEIARLSSGFIYYLSISGITGERDQLPPGLEDNIHQLKDLTDRPICVGFGVSRPEHLQQLAGVADGVIVGSAIVKQMNEYRTQGPDGIAAAVVERCRQLLAGVR